VVGVAILIAVDELRTNFSQVARSDQLLALHAAGVRAGRPAVHQRKSHMVPKDDFAWKVHRTNPLLRNPERPEIATGFSQQPLSGGLK
jgi:hypothetical protein